MNATPISENQLYPSPNPNILNQFMTFNGVHTWSVISGSGSAANQLSNVLEGVRSLRIQSSVSDGITINSGGTQTETIIPTSGTYIFSFRKLEADQGISTNSVATTIKMFINGTPADIVYYTEMDADQKDIWKTYFVSVDLAMSDVVSFGFEVDSSDVGTTYKQYFDCFKLELDVFGMGYPTVFTPPQNVISALPTASGLYGLRIDGEVASWELIPEE